MATIENNLLVNTSEYQETSDSHIQSLLNLDQNNRDMLRPTLDRIKKMHAHHFNPVRFRFIESMAEKALQHRLSVAGILEKKALKALSDYVKDYASFQKRTEYLDNKKNNNQGKLTRLTQEIFQSDDAQENLSKLTLEDELRQQEKDVIRSAVGIMTDDSGDLSVNEQSKADYNELSAMGHFRQSQVKHKSERLLIRTIQEGPEDAGPLNSQALIIRSLTIMHDLSPSYINRFISYMDTLLWLEQADEEGTTKKTKNKGRRKS